LKQPEISGLERIVQVVGNSNENAKIIVDQIRVKLTSTSAKVIFLALVCLDFCMDKSKLVFHRSVGQKEFMHLLIQMLNNKQLQQPI